MGRHEHRTHLEAARTGAVVRVAGAPPGAGVHPGGRAPRGARLGLAGRDRALWPSAEHGDVRRVEPVVLLRPARPGAPRPRRHGGGGGRCPRPEALAGRPRPLVPGAPPGGRGGEPGSGGHRAACAPAPGGGRARCPGPRAPPPPGAGALRPDAQRGSRARRPVRARPRDGASADEPSSRSSSVAPRRRRRRRRSSIGSPPVYVAPGAPCAPTWPTSRRSAARRGRPSTSSGPTTRGGRTSAMSCSRRWPSDPRPSSPGSAPRWLAEEPVRRCTVSRSTMSGRGCRRRTGRSSTTSSRTPRLAYGANDDNTTVLCALPLGLVRRAVLELGRRLVGAGPDRRGRGRLRGHHRRAVRARDRWWAPRRGAGGSARPPGEPRPRSRHRPSSARRRRPRRWTSHPAPSG